MNGGVLFAINRLRKRIRSHGFSLIEVSVVIVILAIVGFGFATLMRQLVHSERGAASNVELTDTILTLNLLLSTQAACAKSGVVGLTIDPASPGTTALVIKTPATGGPGADFLREGGIIANARRVTSLRFTELIFIENVAGGRKFFATLRLVTEVVGKGSSVRNPDHVTRLMLVLDAGNNVLECFRNDALKGKYIITTLGALGPQVTATCPGCFAGDGNPSNAGCYGIVNSNYDGYQFKATSACSRLCKSQGYMSGLMAECDATSSPSWNLQRADCSCIP